VPKARKAKPPRPETQMSTAHAHFGRYRGCLVLASATRQKTHIPEFTRERRAGHMPSTVPSITWLAGGAVSVTGAPTVMIALPLPPFVPLGEKPSRYSGLLVSVT